MKTRALFLPKMRACTVGKNRFPYALVVCVAAITALGGLSSCQRANQAYFAPTHHPAPQRLPVSQPAIAATAATDPVLTASLDAAVDLSAKPILEKATAPVASPVLMSQVRQSGSRNQSRRALPGKPAPPQCDQIVLRNGDVIEAKVKEVGVSEIKYKKCDRQDGPDYTISKRDVLSIKYSTGDVERFNTASSPSGNSTTSSSNRTSYDSPTDARNDGPRTDPFAIVALATGVVAIVTGYGAFLLGAVAIVFGALSLSRIRKEPGRFKGRGMAIGGMVAGLVSAGLILLYILL